MSDREATPLTIKIISKAGLLAVYNRKLPNGPDAAPMRRDDFGYAQAHYFSVQLRPIETEVWLDGRQLPVSILGAGTVQVVDQRRSWRAVLQPPFETVNFNVGHGALAELAGQTGSEVVEIVAEPFDAERSDPTLLHLANALLPAFEKPHELSALFAETVATAAALHVLGNYCRTGRQRQPAGAGLAAWQQRRVIEYVRASLERDISLAELAATCGLSPSHFARSFKRSFGIAPHRWVMLDRVRRAQELLRNTAMPLGEIALACGFADQSHFSRVFATVVAMPPGAWRRLQRH